MMTLHSKEHQPLVFLAFGWAVLPERLYEDLVSENEIKRDRIQELTAQRSNLQLEIKLVERQSDSQKNALTDQLRVIDSNSDRQRATIQRLQEQVEELAQTDRNANELIEGLNAHIVTLSENLLTAQKELNAIQETYRRTFVTNAELDLKLEEAIAELSKTEQLYNESTLAATQERIANKIAIDNHRLDVLMALDNFGRKAS